MERSSIRVDIAPLQPEKLASSQPRVDRQQVQNLQPIAFSGLQASPCNAQQPLTYLDPSTSDHIDWFVRRDQMPVLTTVWLVVNRIYLEHVSKIEVPGKSEQRRTQDSLGTFAVDQVNCPSPSGLWPVAIRGW